MACLLPPALPEPPRIGQLTLPSKAPADVLAAARQPSQELLRTSCQQQQQQPPLRSAFASPAIAATGHCSDGHCSEHCSEQQVLRPGLRA